MLPRPLNEIYERIRDYVLFITNGKTVGVVALHVVWEDIAEMRSLSVDEGYEKQNIGGDLVKWGLDQAKEVGVKSVFALSYVPDFFKKHGFHGIDKQTLPHKIWSDCVRCHMFPDCDETAVSIDLS